MTALIAGCSGGSPAASTTSSTPRTSTAPSEAATESASAVAASATESAAASIAADADLATLLPTTLSGEPVTSDSFDGEQVADLPLGNLAQGGMSGLAQSVGVPLTDIRGAAAFAQDHEQFNAPHAVMAVRIPGTEADAIIDTLSAAIGGMRVMSGELTVAEGTVGGKSVSVLGDSPYFYVVGDVAFVVWTDDPSEAEDVLQDLP